MVKNYINLSNGIEAIRQHGLTEYSFIRLQSTACEQKRWDFILSDIDHDFLMNIALGNEIHIFDYGKKGRTRALWQGIAWIRYALSRCWLNQSPPCVYKNYDMAQYFGTIYMTIQRNTIKRLEYYRKFLLVDNITFHEHYAVTVHDGDYQFYRCELARKLPPLTS